MHLGHLRLTSETARHESGVSEEDAALANPAGERWWHLAYAGASALGAALLAAALTIQACRELVGWLVLVVVCTLVTCIATESEEPATFGLVVGGFLVLAVPVAAVGRGTPTEHQGVLAFAGLTGGVVWSLLRLYRWTQRWRRGLGGLHALHESAARFDRLVNSMEVLEDYQRIHGHACDQAERARVVSSFVSTRDNLVRTLRTERLLRENRAVLREVGSGALREALVPMEAVRAETQAGEYARLVAENLAIAAEIQHAFHELGTRAR